MVDLGKNWKLSSWSIKWRWNHGNPTVGLQERRRPPFDRFAPPPVTPSSLGSPPQASTSRCLPKHLSWRVCRSDVGKGFKREGSSYRKKEEEKKKRKRKKISCRGREKEEVLANREVGKLNFWWASSEFKKKMEKNSQNAQRKFQKDP